MGKKNFKKRKNKKKKQKKRQKNKRKKVKSNKLFLEKIERITDDFGNTIRNIHLIVSRKILPKINNNYNSARQKISSFRLSHYREELLEKACKMSLNDDYSQIENIKIPLGHTKFSRMGGNLEKIPISHTSFSWHP